MLLVTSVVEKLLAARSNQVGVIGPVPEIRICLENLLNRRRASVVTQDATLELNAVSCFAVSVISVSAVFSRLGFCAETRGTAAAEFGAKT